MFSRLFRKLFEAFNSRDTRSIEIYFELLNVWWLFVLWHPSTDLHFRALTALAAYQDMLIGLVFIAALLAVAAFTSRLKMLRITVLVGYITFYLLTGINLITTGPTIDPLGGFFICQSVLAALLMWKIQARTGNQGTSHDTITTNQATQRPV